MKAMVVKRGWLSNTLEQRRVQIPEIKEDQVLINVCAVGVNRVDVLECSGIIEALGRNVRHWKVGQRVCAINVEEGGGYAEKVVVPAEFLLPLPDYFDLDDAAALPYESCVIWLVLSKMHTRQTGFPDKWILIREGSIIAPLAIQYAKYMGFKVVASTGNCNNFDMYVSYGAEFCVDHTATNFVRQVFEKLGYRGVDFVLDYGASDLQRNIACCRTRGMVAIVHLHGVKRTSIDLNTLLKAQAEIKVFNSRFRDFRDKASVIAGLKINLWPAVLQGRVFPVIEHRFPMEEAQKALDLVKGNDSSFGKIIVCVNLDKSSSGHLKTK
ncbi:uncharacterized protein [Henckelia pumila]|uniref:uncharacterized protein n=1 Tax=Henckelia pumila TaxID=405737 RepID=UPI003C6DC052